MSMPIGELIGKCRTPLINVEPEAASQFDYLQPKFDGWWALMHVTASGSVEVYSRGGELVSQFNVTPGHPAVVIGEFMYGSNWAQSHWPGHFFLHDVYWSGKFFEQTGYMERYRECDRLAKIWNNELIQIVPNFDMRQIAPHKRPAYFETIWDKFVVENRFEGLVLKSENGGFGVNALMGRKKKVWTMDYVCVDMTEGGGKNAGKLGALVGGLYVNGRLTPVCSVGGGFTDALRVEFWNNKEKYVGRVFQAYGMDLFGSGALRHPNLDKDAGEFGFRSDKLPEECVWGG